jgi:hypothetical protein
MAIILSYSRKDEAVVKALAEGLEAAKREVWFDHDLGGGDAWWDSILENIRTATVFLFALSDASLHSKPCRLELDYALELGRPIVPVQVGPVTSFRASPLAKLQIIGYNPDNAQSGFTVLAAVDDAVKRERPLPDPLPAPPPIPFAYILALGRQIDSVELSMADQVAVVDQLRRALGEETDETVRQDILSMLKNLDSKPWTAKWTEREIAALLYAHSERPRPDREEATVRARRPEDRDPAAAAEPSRLPQPDPDPREWLAERLEKLLEQRAAEQAAAEKEASHPDPPPWRLPPDAAARWGQTFGRDEGSSSAAGPSPAAEPYSGTPAPPAPTWTSPSPSPKPPSYFATSAPPQTGQQPVAVQPTPPPYAAASPGPWAPVVGAPTMPEPPSHRRMTIVSAVLSLWLFGGGIAMYFSRQVGRRYQAGDLEGARRASRKAKVWGIVGMVVGPLVLLLIVLL